MTNKNPLRRVLGIVCILLVHTVPFTSEAKSYNYYQRSVMIPMRDGVELYTLILSPEDSCEKHPIIIERTPYGAGGYNYTEDKKVEISGMWAENHYIIVKQDVRGRNMSEGKFEHVRPYEQGRPGLTDEATDSYDTIEWLVSNVRDNNGRVAVSGCSYPGFYAFMAALSRHPALKFVIPQAPCADWWMGDDAHHNGAFALNSAYGFFPSLDAQHEKPSASYDNPFYEISGYSVSKTKGLDKYDFFLNVGNIDPLTQILRKNRSCTFWNDCVLHPDYDWFWQERNICQHAVDIIPAMLVVGGLYDAEDYYGAIQLYHSMLAQSQGTDLHLIIGPWSHGSWNRNDKEADRFLETAVRLANYYLKDEGTISSLPHAQVYFPGDDEQWRTFDKWTQTGTSLRLWFDKDCRLSTSIVKGKKPISSYISDPASPVPYSAKGGNKAYMWEDQNFMMGRNDYCHFSTEALDTVLRISGPVSAKLRVSISGEDADFVVKLIDYDPIEGTHSLVRADIFRGRYRHDFSHPEPFTPGKVEEVCFELPDIAYSWKAGHILEVHVQSSWFPLFDRNPQTWTDNIYLARKSDYRACTIKIHPGSHIELPRL